MKNIDMYWASNPDWFDFNDALLPIMRENAPPEAKNSYLTYMKRKGYEAEEPSEPETSETAY